MKNILAAAQRELLEQICWSNVLVGFDFDGTLAPIVSDPVRAELRAPTRRRFTDLARSYPCVVISGRAVRDVERRLAGVELRAVIGNHGLEPWNATEDMRATVELWRARFERALASHAGIAIEDKVFSLALHYRRSRNKSAARAAIQAVLRDLEGARAIGGKQVVNVLPPGAPHKGVALERERARAGCDTCLYVGDDETDEDVFALERPGRLFTVRVGNDPRSQASYYLESQRSIDLLLERMLAARRTQATKARR